MLELSQYSVSKQEDVPRICQLQKQSMAIEISLLSVGNDVVYV